MAGVPGAFRSLKHAFPWLKVVGNTALAGFLFGLETLLGWSTPCPCDPELNTGHVVVMFLMPALILFMITLAALPASRRLLMCWACRGPICAEKEECSCCRCCCRCCSRCCSRWKRRRFPVIKLLEALMPSFIWICILLIDGDHVACIYQTQADVRPGHSQDCQNICSDDPTPQLRYHCNTSWIIGCVLLVVIVGLLTILHYIPLRKCCDCTQEGGCTQRYYEAVFSNELEDAMEIKMEKKIKENAAKRADVKAQKLMVFLKLRDTEDSEQGPTQ